MYNQTKAGFTLIELLVVVLIIGILAAISLPQYQKAALKSRTVQLQTLADALRTAQQIYYLEHGTYAEKFEDLDITIPAGATITPYQSSGQQAQWPNQMIAYTLVSKEVTYVRNARLKIGIQSKLGGGHRCISYTKLADEVCLSLGGTYLHTACATAENLANGEHGCRVYHYL